MKTKIRISMWLTAMVVVFFGIGLSSQKAFAASGLHFQRLASISGYSQRLASASVSSVLPSIGVAPSELSASHWQEMARFTAPFYAASESLGVGSPALSATDLGEQSLIKGYRLQAIARFSSASESLGVGSPALSATDLGEQSLIKGYRLQALARFSGALPSSGSLNSLSGVGIFDERTQAIAEFSVRLPSSGVGIFDERTQAIAESSVRLPSTGINLTTLSEADIAAYRWQAMASFYALHPFAGVDLTKLSAADVSVYRWQAMAQYYSTHPKPWR